MAVDSCPVRAATWSRKSRLEKPQGRRRNKTRTCHKASTRRSVVRRAEVRWPLTSMGTVQMIHGFFSHGAVVAETFDFEKTSVGVKADLPESRQVTQSFAEVEVTGVVDGGFGADPDLGDAGDRFHVLLDVGI